MRRILIAMMLLAAMARPAGATVGGEWLCEVLGYDPSTKRVYVHELDGTAGSTFGRVLYATLSGDSAGVFRIFSMHTSGRDDFDSPELLRQLAALRGRLKALPELIWPTLPMSTRILQRDSIPSEFEQPIRMRVRASFGIDVELTCWRSDGVSRPAVYELPDRAGWLWVIAYIGDPFETGYETQVPVVVRTGTRETIPVKWGRARE